MFKWLKNLTVDRGHILFQTATSNLFPKNLMVKVRILCIFIAKSPRRQHVPSLLGYRMINELCGDHVFLIWKDEMIVVSRHKSLEKREVATSRRVFKKHTEQYCSIAVDVDTCNLLDRHSVTCI